MNQHILLETMTKKLIFFSFYFRSLQNSIIVICRATEWVMIDLVKAKLIVGFWCASISLKQLPLDLGIFVIVTMKQQMFIRPVDGIQDIQLDKLHFD